MCVAGIKVYYSYPSLILWGSLVHRFEDPGVLVPKPQMSKLRTTLPSNSNWSCHSLSRASWKLGTQGPGLLVSQGVGMGHNPWQAL